MRTDQEIRIQAEVLDLIDTKHIVIKMYAVGENDNSDCASRNPKTPTTSAERRGNNSVIFLVEGESKDVWEDAIKKGKEILKSIQEEFEHEANHPNFFKALRSQLP